MKMRAMLLDHTAGPNSHIRVGPISEADYMMTGKKADGTDTKEMEALKKSAQETVDAAKKTPQKAEAVRGANDRDKKEQSAKTKNRKKAKVEKVNTDPERETVRAAIKDIPSEQAPEKIIFTKHPTRPDASVEKVLQNTISDVRIRSQEYQRQYGTESVFWIKQKPLYENRQYAQFLMPDGKNSIFIRQADILPGRDAQTGMRLAAVFTDQRYSMMNMEKVNVVAADGSKAIAMFKLPGGAVIAHGNQQPDKKKGGPELAKGTQKKEQTTGNKTVRSPEKTKSR